MKTNPNATGHLGWGRSFASMPPVVFTAAAFSQSRLQSHIDRGSGVAYGVTGPGSVR
jgi:hypothetical protein